MSRTLGGSGVPADIVDEVAARLAAAGVPTPWVDARWLIRHVTDEVGDAAGAGAGLLADLVERRAARVPLQVVLGRWGFRGVELACREGVFVPRPETEVVAGVAIEAARRAGPRPLVAEPCTGSGAIAASLVNEVPGVEVVAGDLDDRAVALARDNLAAVPAAPGASGRALQMDLLDGLDLAWRGRLDVLVANPPYLPHRDRRSWVVEVAAYEPEAALVGGEDGHEIVDALLQLASTWLRPGGTVVIEIDERRGDDVLASAGRAGLVGASLVPDLAGRSRAVVARRRWVASRPRGGLSPPAAGHGGRS